MSFAETDALFYYDHPVVDEHVNKYSVVLKIIDVNDAYLYLRESHFIFVLTLMSLTARTIRMVFQRSNCLDTMLNCM